MSVFYFIYDKVDNVKKNLRDLTAKKSVDGMYKREYLCGYTSCVRKLVQ